MLFSILNTPGLSATQAVMLFLIITVVFLFSLAMHEFAHGFVAYKMGDDTPKLAGRLTANPFRHLSGSGFLMFILIGVGWAKPMPVNPLNFKRFRAGQRLVSIAGVLANLILGLISAVLYAVLFAIIGAETILAHTALGYLFDFLAYMMLINSFLFMFNIIPLFPLDGYNFVVSFVKKPNNKFINFNAKYGMITLYGIIIATIFIDLFTGVDILSYYLSVLYDWVFWPIALLGV